jgi:glycosyltransferase involved in cell wall biosynthesis
MKILNYSSIFLPNKGGVAHNIFYFAKFSKMKHIVLTDQLPNTKQFEIIENIDIHRIHPIKNSFTIKKIFSSYLLDEIKRDKNKLKKLNDLEFDLLHLRGPYLSSDLQYFLDCFFGISFFKNFSIWKSQKKPIISTFHALLSATKFVTKQEEKDFWFYNEKKSWEKYEKFICSQSNEIICVDHYHIEKLKKLSNGKPIHFIPSGVDLNIFYPVEKSLAKKELPKDLQNLFEFNHILLVIGRLSVDRGLIFLEKLSEKLPNNIKIIVLGSGKMIPKSKKIRFLGSIENSLLPFFINASDIIFQPLIAEGISRVSLESLACGKPVIMRGSKMDRYPLVNGKNGYVVDSIEEAKNIINELLNSSNLYKSISKNALKTSAKFDVKELSKKIDSIYLSIKY